MALIRFANCEFLIPLRTHQVFGRNSHSQVPSLANRKISKAHCQVYWHQNTWWVKDLSKNGTGINNTRCPLQKEMPIHHGDTLTFADDLNIQCTLIDASPPTAMLVNQGAQQTFIELQDFNALPNTQAPIVFIYRTERDEWVYEYNNIEQTLRDGERLIFDGSEWVFIDARALDFTLDSGAADCEQLDNTTLHFKVSQNQEHVILTLEHNGVAINMGERTHHFLLFTLAQQRIKDSEAGISLEEQGWIDMELLSTMLGLEVSHTNVQIYRARKQFCETLEAPQFLQLIERRRGAARIANVLLRIASPTKTPQAG